MSAELIPQWDVMGYLLREGDVVAWGQTNGGGTGTGYIKVLLPGKALVAGKGWGGRRFSAWVSVDKLVKVHVPLEDVKQSF